MASKREEAEASLRLAGYKPYRYESSNNSDEWVRWDEHGEDQVWLNREGEWATILLVGPITDIPNVVRGVSLERVREEVERVLYEATTYVDDAGIRQYAQTVIDRLTKKEE